MTDSISSAKDSIDAMLSCAKEQLWLQDNELIVIPELVSVCKSGSERILEMINNAEPEAKNEMALCATKYLFAKGVEAVILWGISSDGIISIDFHPEHITEKFETGVPAHLHSIVENTMGVGKSLFSAHQQWVSGQLKVGNEVDIDREIENIIEWSPSFGVHFAMHNNFDIKR